MIRPGRTSTLSLFLLIAASYAAMAAITQQTFTVLTGAELTRVVPPGFYSGIECADTDAQRGRRPVR